MQTVKAKLKRTTWVESIINESSAKYDSENQTPKRIMAYFERWPIEEIRLACLGGMEHSFQQLQHLDWAREVIESLVEISDRDMALKVMEQYADVVRSEARYAFNDGRGYYHDDAPKQIISYDSFHGESVSLWNEFVQMLRFAVHIVSIKPEFLRPMLKIVCSCVDPEVFPGCYYHKELQSVKVLFTWSLDKITMGQYDESDWHPAFRSLSMIAKVKDREYIDQLKLVIKGHEETESRDGFVINFSHISNLAVLRETLRILKQPVKKPE